MPMSALKEYFLGAVLRGKAAPPRKIIGFMMMVTGGLGLLAFLGFTLLLLLAALFGGLDS